MDLKAARLKYLKLGEEIDKYCSGEAWSNMHHTHSKLGIFLDAELGKAWRHASNQPVEQTAKVVHAKKPDDGYNDLFSILSGSE